MCVYLQGRRGYNTWQNKTVNWVTGRRFTPGKCVCLHVGGRMVRVGLSTLWYSESADEVIRNEISVCVELSLLPSSAIRTI